MPNISRYNYATKIACRGGDFKDLKAATSALVKQTVALSAFLMIGIAL